MKAYFGSRISQNKTKTPEGFLVAHNVPIARTGWYQYHSSEIGADGDRIVDVYRDPDEVFSPSAMASFQGKPLTNNHPSEGVDPHNSSTYTKGVVDNVRPGKGEEEDLLLADLIVHDEQLIKDIESGKREVSAGYECDYVPNDDGTYSQKNIVGNHVAVVDAGRAGDRVRIKDSKTVNGSGNQSPKGSDHNNQSQNTKARYSRMSEIKLPTRKPGSVTRLLAAVGLKHFAMDAEPEEVMDAVESMAEERAKDEQAGAGDFPVPTTQEVKSADDEGDQNAIAKLAQQVAALTQLVHQALAPKQEQAPEDALDAEIDRLEKEDDGDDDESKTIEANDEEGPVSDPEDRPQSAFKAADSAVAYLKAMKPVIAKLKDPAEKKMMVDAALKAVKGTPSKPSATYQKMTKPAKAQDTAPKADPSDLGREIMRKHNPHYKNKEA